jgi:hypothetical protein
MAHEARLLIYNGKSPMRNAADAKQVQSSLKFRLREWAQTSGEPLHVYQMTDGRMLLTAHSVEAVMVAERTMAWWIGNLGYTLDVVRGASWRKIAERSPSLMTIDSAHAAAMRGKEAVR